MSFFKGALLATALTVASLSSANALVVPTTNGNYEYGGLEQPIATPAPAPRVSSGNATWPADRETPTF